jgi:hypothetical protein
MAAETQYTASTLAVTIATANSNLDGTTGTYGTLITANASLNGLFIKNIWIKATTNTSQGMIRIFVGDSRGPKLIKEVEVPAVVKSASSPAFEAIVPMNFVLKPNYVVIVSTEVANTFNVFADAQDYSYYASSVRSETTKYTIKNGAVKVDTANSNLDGTDAVDVFQFTNPSNLQAILVKAIQSTTEGMVRLYLTSGGSTRLFKEIPVAAQTASDTAPAFLQRFVLEDSFAIPAEWYLKASTEKGESFNVVAEILEWTYPA